MYIINGKATINGIQVTQGSGLSFVNENKLTLENPEDEPEILLFNLR